MELQEQICRARDEITAIRQDRQDAETAFETAKETFKKIKDECNHTYVGAYHGRYEGQSTLHNGVCEICHDWE